MICRALSITTSSVSVILSLWRCNEKKKKDSIKPFLGRPGAPEVRTPCFNCREHGVRSLIRGTAVKTNKQKPFSTISKHPSVAA